ncbi:MAG: PBP1A family penicillin-binding protein [Candidatus Moraniibacteriota bacterium]
MKIKSLLKISFLVLTICFFMGFFSLSGYGYQLYKETPAIEGINTFRMKQTSVIYDRTEETVLYEIHGTEDRKVISYENIPAAAKIATIAAEDDNFFEHKGFDPISILRAAKINLENKESLQGASTITQQLARDLYLTREKTYERKIKELILAVKMEKTTSKEEILEMYLNKITYGSNIYGIQSASEKFFDKDAQALTLDEAALLAALPKAPGALSPYGKNTKELEKRQKNILLKINEMGLVKEGKINEALAINTLEKIKPRKDEIISPHFVFYVIKQLEEKYGEKFIKEGGLKITTTLDLEMQNRGQEIAKRKAHENKEKWSAENAALVAMNPKEGEILAMIGSRDYFDLKIDGEVNVATRPRQPGSSFKPLVYAAAFEKGFQPETKLYDVKTDFGPDGSGKNYIPRNYSGSFHGLISMRNALAGSINVPAVKTIYLAEIDNTVKLAKKMGINSIKSSKGYGLSLALGSAEISLLEEVSAYSVFANEGKRINPTAIKKITDSAGQVIFKHKKEKEKILQIETARKINSILTDKSARQTTFGSSNSLEIPGRQVAVKTGTTQNYQDAWTVGYTPSLAVGVWTGNNDNSPMLSGAAGVFVAAPIWNEFSSWALQKYPNEEFKKYEKQESDIPMITGKIEENVVFYNEKSGEKLDSKEKIEKTDPDKIRTKNDAEKHSILYYIDKDNLREAKKENKKDPMLELWEKAIHKKDDDKDDKK